jgi:MFS family permease
VSRKQLIALFLCSIVPWTVGNGLVPLLPVYATSLGAAPGVAGAYMGISYLALALGALSAGRLSERLGRRKLPLIVAGVLSL